MKQRPKYTNGGILKTMGHLKGLKSYGGGDSVRESGFRCFSSIANINDDLCVSLKELIELNKNNLFGEWFVLGFNMITLKHYV